MFTEANIPDGDTKWADGVRGLAAILVVSSHLCISFAPQLVFTPTPEMMVYSFWHWPFIRPFAEGFPWVALFLLLSGFVNALKPIKQMRDGQPDASLRSLATSSFRRSLRLVIPCTIATFISWAICQLGGYQIGNAVDNGWMVSTSPEPSRTMGQAIRDLTWTIYTTWTTADSYYDKNQWTMMWFLKGSMALYLALLATTRAKPSMRMFIIFGLFAWSWKGLDVNLGIPTYSGVLLAELSMLPSIHRFASSRTILQRSLSWFLMIVGWFLISFPNIHPEWAPWYNIVREAGELVLPEGSNIFAMVLYIGMFMILAAFLLSTAFQAVFVHPVLLWLGRHSFPIYLLHGPLLRSFFNWILFAFIYPYYRTTTDDTGAVIKQELAPLPHAPRWKFCFALPVFFAVLLYLSKCWMEFVDPWCAKLTRGIEDIVTGKQHVFLSFGVGAARQETLLLPLNQTEEDLVSRSS